MTTERKPDIKAGEADKKVEELRIGFLDFDGVFTATGRSFVGEGETVDSSAVAMLRRLIKDTGVKWVISSVWRSEWRDWLRAQTFFDVIGMSKNCLYHPREDEDPNNWRTTLSHDRLRGNQIKQWLEAHPEVTNYIIIDDDSDMLPEQMDRFVHTDGREGFGYRDYHRALCLLTGKPLDSCEVRPFKPRGCVRHFKVVAGDLSVEDVNDLHVQATLTGDKSLLEY